MLFNTKNKINSNTEIRKVPMSSIYKIILILEETDSWKKLMNVIPKDLHSTAFVPKYNDQHITTIENASIRQNRLCTEILFDEWGTSGETRPTLQHLKHLLVKCELFRAADIVALDLLNEPVPERPKTGPAALVDPSVTKLIAEKENKKRKLNIFLEKMSHPFKLTVDGNDDRINNKYLDKLPTNDINKVLPFQTTLSKSNTQNNIYANTIKFVGKKQQGKAPINNEDSLNNMPAFSKLLMHDRRTDEKNSTQTLPRFTLSKIRNATNGSIVIYAIPSVDESVNHSRYQGTVLQPVGSARFSMSSLNDLPLISVFENDGSNSPQANSMSISSFNDTESTSSKGTDTGEQIIVNTVLPSYNYDVILASTNNFSKYCDIEKKIGGKIGEGGFGEVYVGFTSSGPIAVKRLFINKGSNFVLKQFKTEVETLSQYVHKNIVSILGYSLNQPSTYCIIYEHVGGGTLRNKLDVKCLNWQERLQIAYNISQGLEYLHYGTGKMLIHRDIKSDNILLSKDLTPKLCDFGFAKLMFKQDAMTTKIIGTPAYMASEVFKGDVSDKMDVFSFGIVLLELLTGLPPTDDSREMVDILTHVQFVCPGNEITSLLDPVLSNSKNYANEIFAIAKRCLFYKWMRPNIKVVRIELEKLYFHLCE